MTKKVFVGGIASTTKEEDVRVYFGQYGKVRLSLKIVNN